LFYKTLDGGETWNYLQLWNRVLNAVSFPGVSIGYGIGYNWMGGSGILLKTVDGGATWLIQDSIISCALNSVCFLNSDTGYTVGNCGTILKTTNGGGYPVGIEKQDQTTNALNIYPNPASITITIETLIPGIITILNPSGQVILQKEIAKPTTTIDVRGWNSGVYVVKLIGEKGVQVGKMIRQ
jgi:hypothetical protein